ncbi:MAG: 2,3-bisphosphoglycerate-independent phosphoglycerate mutase [Patescibacteria group bacterium]
MAKKYNPVLLIILDGFGISPDKIASPWEAASHPTISEIEEFYPFTALQASGMAVGLPWGKEGNSEVGHLTIGAGKIIYNYLPRITTSIQNHSFFENESFLKAVKHIGSNRALHIAGLYSSGTVHAYEEHLYALLEFAKENGLKNVYLHLFTDGKDAYHKEGIIYFKKLEDLLEKNYTFAKIASVIGRNLAMDRDGNWAKTSSAYQLFTEGKDNKFLKASEYLNEQYQKEIFDPNIEPAFLDSTENTRVKDGDALIFYNFREDSERQITQSFIEETFEKFERKKINNLVFVAMTEYYKGMPALVAFKSPDVEFPLAKIISGSGLKQFHIAESEKYAHITYFLNGGREEVFPEEKRVLIESPRTNSYDQIPEMSAEAITETIIKNLGKFNFFAVNFANADMVGHTANFIATTKALECLDSCLGQIIARVLEINGVCVITSDHGNAEEKLYKLSGQKKTKHSTNPVPFYIVGNDFRRKNPRTAGEIIAGYKDIKGTLTDIAPTILELFGLKKPATMTGKSLLEKII